VGQSAIYLVVVVVGFLVGVGARDGLGGAVVSILAHLVAGGRRCLDLESLLTDPGFCVDPVAALPLKQVSRSQEVDAGAVSPSMHRGLDGWKDKHTGETNRRVWAVERC
jgi:hypothetical protein